MQIPLVPKQPILNDEKAERIISESINILETVGIGCGEAVAVKLRACVPFEYKNNRMCFSRPAMLNHLELRKGLLHKKHQPTTNRITAGGQCNAWYYLDPVTNIPRYATLSEAIDMAHFVECIGTKRSAIPVTPGEIPGIHHALECERIGLIHTKSLGGILPVSNDYEVESLIDMNNAAGRRYTMMLSAMISPLRFNDDDMLKYMQWYERSDLNVTVCGPLPMLGATAPMALPAALSMVLAEALAQDYMIYTYTDGRQSNFGFRLDPFDIKTMNVVYGSPEWSLLRQSVIELWGYVTGTAYTGGSFRSNARRIDAQCLIDRTFSFIHQVSCGVTSFSGVGQLSVDEMFSPVLAILDNEMVKWVERLFKGLDGIWDDSVNIQELLTKGTQAHGFLDDDYTVNLFRDMYDLTRMTSYENYNAWLAGGKKGIEEQAWAKAQDIIKTNNFRIDDDKEREINRICETAKAKVSQA